MDNPIVHGSGQGSIVHKDGDDLSAPGPGQLDGSSDLGETIPHVNGSKKGNFSKQASQDDLAVSAEPFELSHITHGFFPFAKLLNRAVQQCWNELSEVITELAEVHVPSQNEVPAGKSPGNQSAENVHKKLRILDFAHAKRAEFIKLLVLSQWSQHAADVSKLIDIQGFIRTRHLAYNGAIQLAGDMKRDLVRAQVATPDLKTALEVLTRGKVEAMPDVSYQLYMHTFLGFGIYVLAANFFFFFFL